MAPLAGITAQVGFKRRPGRNDGKPAGVAENRLEQPFEASMPDQVWVGSDWIPVAGDDRTASGWGPGDRRADEVDSGEAAQWK